MPDTLHEAIRAALIAAIGEQSGCGSCRCTCFGATEVLECKLGVDIDDLTAAAVRAVANVKGD